MWLDRGVTPCEERRGQVVESLEGLTRELGLNPTETLRSLCMAVSTGLIGSYFVIKMITQYWCGSWCVVRLQAEKHKVVVEVCLLGNEPEGPESSC